MPVRVRSSEGLSLPDALRSRQGGLGQTSGTKEAEKALDCVCGVWLICRRTVQDTDGCPSAQNFGRVFLLAPGDGVPEGNSRRLFRRALQRLIDAGADCASDVAWQLSVHLQQCARHEFAGFLVGCETGR